MRLFEHDRAAHLMDEDSLDVVVTHTKHNGSYLADHWWVLGDPGFLNTWTGGYQWWATFVGLPRDNSQEPFIVGYTAEAAYMDYEDVWIRDRRYWGPPVRVTGRAEPIKSYPDPIVGVAQALLERGLGESNIGLEMRLMPVPFYRQLNELLPKAIFKDAEPFLQKLQMIKSPEEIERLRVASRATERAIEIMYQAAHEGVTDFELVKIIKRALVEEGADYMWDDLAIGPKGATMVGASGEILHEGEIVRVDLGGTYKGYPCDMSRARVFGKPNPAMQRVHDAIRTTNETLRGAVGPGVKCSDLYRLGTEMMKRNGLKLLNEYLGHSIGREQVHQLPALIESDDTLLQPRMVLVVEPTVRMEGIGSINIEDMVLVTEAGHEELTTISQRLYPIA